MPVHTCTERAHGWVFAGEAADGARLRMDRHAASVPPTRVLAAKRGTARHPPTHLHDLQRGAKLLGLLCHHVSAAIAAAVAAVPQTHKRQEEACC